MKLNKNERYFLGFVWAIALGAICFAYAHAINKQNKPEVSECAVYVPANGAVVMTRCADNKKQ